MITSAQLDKMFDYQAPAELFTSKSMRVRSRILKYMRFSHAVDAIRFAIEKLPADVLLGAYLEIDEKRFDSPGIRRLYESPRYPCPRLAKAA